MFGVILQVRKSSFHKGMSFCRSIYVRKVMKLLAFIFEQPRSNTCLDYLKNHKATKPAFNNRPSLVRQRNAI